MWDGAPKARYPVGARCVHAVPRPYYVFMPIDDTRAGFFYSFIFKITNNDAMTVSGYPGTRVLTKDAKES